MFEKRWHSRARGSTGQNGVTRSCCAARGGGARKLGENFSREEVTRSCLGARSDCADFLASSGECVGFFGGAFGLCFG